jgi:hypothetical protein
MVQLYHRNSIRFHDVCWNKLALPLPQNDNAPTGINSQARLAVKAVSVLASTYRNVGTVQTTVL